MGEERETKGKHLLLYGASLLVIFLSVAGCAAALNLQNKWQGHKRIDLAENLAGRGDYDQALNEDEAVIRLFPGDSPGDRALFHMGIILAHPENPKKNYKKAIESFQQLAGNFPGSALREEARVWTGVIKELIRYEEKVKELEGTVSAYKKQVHTMKEIDIGIEEKKREDLLRK
ncbi:MAG: hypothetical protein QG578_1894 [Thermodesulfobacteriota bacterium]|nr:hypothetical protein [Thermodesulfobacteriota bacterium]